MSSVQFVRVSSEVASQVSLIIAASHAEGSDCRRVLINRTIIHGDSVMTRCEQRLLAPARARLTQCWGVSFSDQTQVLSLVRSVLILWYYGNNENDALICSLLCTRHEGQYLADIFTRQVRLTSKSSAKLIFDSFQELTFGRCFFLSRCWGFVFYQNFDLDLQHALELDKKVIKNTWMHRWIFQFIVSHNFLLWFDIYNLSSLIDHLGQGKIAGFLLVLLTCS